LFAIVNRPFIEEREEKRKDTNEHRSILHRIHAAILPGDVVRENRRVPDSPTAITEAVPLENRHDA
jgi:hypothetical protein